MNAKHCCSGAGENAYFNSAARVYLFVFSRPEPGRAGPINQPGPQSEAS